MNFKQLKILAVCCMFFDHVTRIFPIERMLFPLINWLWANGMESASDAVLEWIPYLFGFIGRLGAPIFLFCIVNGFLHTHDIKKYIARVAITAVMAQIPYVLFDLAEFRLMGGTRSWWEVEFNILFTLAVGLTALALFAELKRRGHLFCALSVAVAAGALCRFARFEGKEGYILLIFSLYLLRGCDKRVQTAVLVPATMLSRVRLVYYAVAVTNGMMRSAFLNVFGNYLGLLIPVWFYNGKKGNAGKRFQIFIYVFYPLHLLLLAIVGYLRPPF